MIGKRFLVTVLAVVGLLAIVSCSGGGNHGPLTRFAGMVYDSYGNPLPDMTVLVNGTNTGVKSDGRGNFDLAPAVFSAGVASLNRISIMDGGVIIVSEEIVPENVRERVFQFPKADGPTGDLVGYVFDDYNAVQLGDVSLIIFNPNLGLFKTMSGPDGNFGFANIPAGYYRITARKDGYHVGIASVEVKAGDQTYQGISLQPVQKAHYEDGVIVKGHITDKKTGWGIGGAKITMTVDTGFIGTPEPWMGGPSNPQPLDDPDATTNYGPDSMPPWRYDPQYQETVSQDDGYFEFTDPAVGYAIYLNYWKDGYLSGNFYMNIGDITEDIVLTLELEPLVMTSASGRVIDDEGQPVKNAWVEFIFAGDEIKYYDDGTTPLGVPNDPSWGGFGDASSSNQGSGGSVPSAPPGMENRGNGGDNPLDNPLMQQYRWENRNGHTGQAAGDQPFSGYFGLTTNDNGEFTIDELPVGAYYTFVSAYKHLAISGDVLVVEEPASNYFEFVISKIPVGSVMGVVKDENGIAVANALVNCVQPFVDPFTYTNGNGEYRIDNIPTGDWIVSAFKYGYRTDSSNVAIAEDQVHSINLNIQTYTPPQVTTVHFTGRVIDGQTGEGIVGARMIFTTSDNQFFSDTTSTVGGFYSAELIPTEYNVLIQSSEYQDLYIRFYVDSLYPEFDFSLWPISGGMGPWGGIVPGMGGRGFEDGGGASGGSGSDESPQPPPTWDPNTIFENRR